MKIAVAAAQFVDQFAQAWREVGFGAEVLLQPFADGVADRHAGLVIDLFDMVAGCMRVSIGRLYEFHLAALARLE